jgi:GNAT superfamily N-acetyltransferase
MAMPALTVRPALLTDRDAVWPLARDFATSFQPELGAFEPAYAGLVEAPQTLLLVAEHESSGVVGYLLASMHLTFLANGPVAWVEEVMVEERVRRDGVGRALMAAAERWARERGAVYVSLASRRAGPFYLALGYDDSAVFFKKTLDT